MHGLLEFSHKVNKKNNQKRQTQPKKQPTGQEKEIECNGLHQKLVSTVDSIASKFESSTIC